MNSFSGARIFYFYYVKMVCIYSRLKSAQRVLIDFPSTPLPAHEPHTIPLSMDLHEYFHIEMSEYFKQFGRFIDLLAFQMINCLDCPRSLPVEHVGCSAVSLR